MKRALHIFLNMAQIGVIITAVLLTIIRLGVHNVGGFENHVEAWFQEQGVNTEINKLFVKVDGFTPTLHIKGLDIVDKNNNTLLSLSTATLHLNLFQSILKSHLIIDSAEFFIKKAVINSALLNQENVNKNTFKIPPEVAHSLLALKHFTITVKQLDYVVSHKKSFPIYNSKISLLDNQNKKQVFLSSSLFQKDSNMLLGQFIMDFNPLVKDSTLLGKGFVAINIPSLDNINAPKELALKGSLNWQSWIDFDGLSSQVISLIDAKKINFNYEGNVHELEIGSTVHINVDKEEIALLMDNDILKVNDADFSLSKLSTQSKIKEGAFTDVLLQLENIAVNEITNFIPSIPSLKKHTKLTYHLNPKGLVNEFFVSLPNIKQWSQSKVAIKAHQLKWQAIDAFPAINYLDVNAVANKEHFNANISSDSLKILLGSLYSESFKVDSLLTTLNGQMDGQGLLIEIPSVKISRNKASIKGRVNLAFEKDLSPYMFIRLQGKNANFKIVEPFLPQKLMDEDVLKWVKSSIKQADVKTADVMYSGRLENDVNFGVKNNGIFIAALNLKNVDFLYDERWPKVSAKQAELVFKNYQLMVNSNAGQSLDLTATNINFSIANLDDAKANLRLKVSDQLTKQWAFLAESPIKNDIPYFSDISEINGSSNTILRAQFPLTNLSAKDVLFDVKLNTKKAGFALNSLALLLSDLSGELNIDQNGLTINPVAAKWYDQKIKLSAKTSSDRAIRLKVTSSELDVKSLLLNLPPQASRHASGKSPWGIDIVINQESNNQPVVSIDAHSGLKGTSIHLPLPFMLEGADTNYLNVKVDIFNDSHIDLSINLDHSFKAFTRLVENDLKYTIDRANITFGDNDVSTELSKKVVINGDIKELNLDHWAAYLDTDKLDKKGDLLNKIESIDVRIDNLIAYGVDAKNTQLKLKQSNVGLMGRVESSVASGDLFLPVEQGKDVPITLDMDVINITLKESVSSDDERWDYATNLIPNTVVKSKKLLINDMMFSDVNLIIESHKKNLFEIKELTLRHDRVLLNASANWLYDSNKNKHLSKVFITLKGKKFGQSLNQLGLGDTIENGEVKFNGHLNWPRPFWSLDLDEAIGDVQFSLKDGYFKDVEPGGGRFVGLLSLSALPRRLTLDFSDFFKKGLEFDKITGDFKIYEGSMWTENLKMKGSVADVKIVGRTGLKAKDYDQIITVIPQVRDALPVLGSLISGSSVGWAMLLLQKIFADPIDESVSIKYKVTEHWDNPKIEVIEKPKRKETESEIYENS